MLLLWVGTAFAQEGYARMEGRWCDRYNRCKAYTMDLFPTGIVVDSLNRTGTYKLTRTSTGLRTLSYQFGNLTGGGLESPQNCWQEASPPLNPALGSINVCLGVQLQKLRHFDDACESNIGVTYALPEEAGDWSAGRFTPGGGGMWVHKLHYHVINDPTFEQCSGLDHRVRVFMGDADEDPPSDPTLLYEFSLDGDDIPADSVDMVAELPAPLFVGPDESVFLAVEMVRERDGDRLCQFTCGPGEPFIGDLSYWSNGPLAPYSWQDLNEYDVGELLVEAEGIFAP